MKKLNLQEVQQRELEIFKVFTEICKKHGIRYYLKPDFSEFSGKTVLR